MQEPQEGFRLAIRAKSNEQRIILQLSSSSEESSSSSRSIKSDDLNASSTDVLRTGCEALHIALTEEGDRGNMLDGEDGGEMKHGPCGRDGENRPDGNVQRPAIVGASPSALESEEDDHRSNGTLG